MTRLGACFLVLAACASETPDEECELLIMEPCPTCGPGEVLGGVGFGATASYARQPNGNTVVLACGRATYFDASYNIVREASVDVPRHSKIAAALDDDAVFVLEVEASSETPDFPPGRALRALAADGTTRWRTELATDIDVTQVIAFPGGIYLADFYGTPQVAYDRDGNTQAVPGVLGVPDAQGGMIAIDSAFSPSEDMWIATLTAADAAGQVRWSRTWRAPDPAFPGWLELRAYPVASGDVVVAGGFQGATLNLGDATITGTAAVTTAFVARLDATGATRWAYPLPATYDALDIAAIPDGDGALVAGTMPDHDAYTTELRLAAVGAAGLGTELPLGSTSPDSTYVKELLSHGSGQLTAVIHIESVNEFPNDLTIGWHRLESGKASRDYLVELAR